MVDPVSEDSAVVIETRYADASCSGGRSSEVVRTGSTGPPSGLDVDGDGSADIVRGDGGFYFRTEAFAELDAAQAWLFTPGKDEDEFATPSTIDVVFDSSLGRAAGPLATSDVPLIAQAAGLAASGGTSPHRLVSGAVAPGVAENATLTWTTDGAGAVERAELEYDDPADSLGIASVEVRRTTQSVAVPDLDIDGAGSMADVPAIGLLRTTAAWDGACRSAEPGPDLAVLECAVRAVGDSSVQAWLTERGDATSLIPEECDP